MPTTTAFQPSPLAPFQFQATLDGATYIVTVTWNVAGQRWYVNITTTNNVLVLSVPLVATAPPVTIASVTYGPNGYVTLVTQAPHGYRLRSVVSVTITGMAPAAYNGTVLAFVADPVTLVYPLASNPGSATSIGAVQVPLSMTAGYFTSQLTFDTASQTFTVSP